MYISVVALGLALTSPAQGEAIVFDRVGVGTAVTNEDFWRRPLELCGRIAPQQLRRSEKILASGPAWDVYALYVWDPDNHYSLGSEVCIRGVVSRRDGLTDKEAGSIHVVVDGINPDYFFYPCSDAETCRIAAAGDHRRGVEREPAAGVGNGLHFERITVPVAVTDMEYWRRPVEVCGRVGPQVVPRAERVMAGGPSWDERAIFVHDPEDRLERGSPACVRGVVTRRDGLTEAEAGAQGRFHWTADGINYDYVFYPCSDAESCRIAAAGDLRRGQEREPAALPSDD